MTSLFEFGRLQTADEAASIQERFERFHERNPAVYEQLVRLARYVQSRGRKCGIGFLWERMRWELYVERDAAEDFRLNDHYRSRFARLIMEQEPDLAGFFELRELRAL